MTMGVAAFSSKSACDHLTGATNGDKLNMSLRKFLEQGGVKMQCAIEAHVRKTAPGKYEPRRRV
jgi:hypothetical protein